MEFIVNTLGCLLHDSAPPAGRVLLEIKAYTETVKDRAVVVGVVDIVGVFGQELIFRRQTDKGLVLDIVLDADFRSCAERFMSILAVDIAGAGTQIRLPLVGIVVPVIEKSRGAVPPGTGVIGVRYAYRLPDTPHSDP
jgi:hypothetical protein